MKQIRQQYLSAVRSVVVKLGTQLLSDKERKLDAAFIGSMAKQVVSLRERGIQVSIVSSGAVGAGLRELNISQRPTDLAMLQAIAAVGQRRLMDVWAAGFAVHQIPVAQVLLTREDIDDRTRYLNLRNTISAVHELGAIPIINENDTISTDEIVKITFGDNDILAALVAHALRADLLMLLSVVDGVLDGDGQPVRLVENVEQARKLIRAEKSALGKGGMDSKFKAARMITAAGDAIVIADGRMENVLPRILEGEPLGTLFVPGSHKRNSRTRWIGSVRPVGSIVIDDGAVRAVVEKNKSLLPAGVIQVEGPFVRGDVIAIRTPAGVQVARGLSNFSAADVERIRGKKTSQVKVLLGPVGYDEVVHRDNLVVE